MSAIERFTPLHLPGICRTAVEAERKNELSFLIEILKNFLLDVRNPHVAAEYKNIEKLLTDAKRAVSSTKGIGADGLAVLIDDVRLHILRYLNELKKSCPSASYLEIDPRATTSHNKRNPKLYEWTDEWEDIGDEEELKHTHLTGAGSFPGGPGGPDFQEVEPHGYKFSGSLGGGAGAGRGSKSSSRSHLEYEQEPEPNLSFISPRFNLE